MLRTKNFAVPLGHCVNPGSSTLNLIHLNTGTPAGLIWRHGRFIKEYLLSLEVSVVRRLNRPSGLGSTFS